MSADPPVPDWLREAERCVDGGHSSLDAERALILLEHNQAPDEWLKRAFAVARRVSQLLPYRDDVGNVVHELDARLAELANLRRAGGHGSWGDPAIMNALADARRAVAIANRSGESREAEAAAANYYAAITRAVEMSSTAWQDAVNRAGIGSVEAEQALRRYSELRERQERERERQELVNEHHEREQEHRERADEVAWAQIASGLQADLRGSFSALSAAFVGHTTVDQHLRIAMAHAALILRDTATKMKSELPPGPTPRTADIRRITDALIDEALEVATTVEAGLGTADDFWVMAGRLEEALRRADILWNQFSTAYDAMTTSLIAYYSPAVTEPEDPRRERIPAEVQREVWRRDQGRCVECGSQERLEYDHIIPVIKGGGNTVRNVQLLCETCNRRKGARI